MRGVRMEVKGYGQNIPPIAGTFVVKLGGEGR